MVDIRRQVQVFIDRCRGKERRLRTPADNYGRSPRRALETVSPSSELEQIFYAHEGNIAHKWHHYLDIYDRHFALLRNNVAAPRILELGVSRAGSLQLWRKYFGENARILGIDLDPEAAAHSVDQDAAVLIGEQADPAILEKAVNWLGGLDLVIDDASHKGKDQIASFEFLFPRLSPNGFYACEDLQYAYWEKFDGGYQRPGTFIEYTKGLIDRLHAWYLEQELQDEFMSFASTTYAIHIYLALVIFERKSVKRPFHVQIGRTPR